MGGKRLTNTEKRSAFLQQLGYSFFKIASDSTYCLPPLLLFFSAVRPAFLFVCQIRTYQVGQCRPDLAAAAAFFAPAPLFRRLLIPTATASQKQRGSNSKRPKKQRSASATKGTRAS